jgi:hypothetical protein
METSYEYFRCIFSWKTKWRISSSLIGSAISAR